MNLATMAERSAGPSRPTSSTCGSATESAPGYASAAPSIAAGPEAAGSWVIPRSTVGGRNRPGAVDLTDRVGAPGVLAVSGPLRRAMSSALDRLPDDRDALVALADRVALILQPVLAVLAPPCIVLGGPTSAAGGARLATLVAGRLGLTASGFARPACWAHRARLLGARTSGGRPSGPAGGTDRGGGRMKLAIVGGGQPTRRVDRRVRPAPRRAAAGRGALDGSRTGTAAAVSGMARRMLARAGTRPRWWPRTTWSPGWRMPSVLVQCGSAAKPPATGGDLAPRGAVHRSGTTGPGRLRRAAANCAGDAQDRGRGQEARPSGCLDDRLDQPVGIVTRALLQAGHRAVGLCKVAIGFQRRFAATLGVEFDGSASATSG